VGETRNAYKVLVGKTEGKRPLGGLRHKWEKNIRMDLRKIAYVGVDCIQLAQNRVQWLAFVNTVMHSSRRILLHVIGYINSDTYFCR
jgi:hypothetical protein